jgi:hypothetical protein
VGRGYIYIYIICGRKEIYMKLLLKISQEETSRETRALMGGHKTAS